MTRLIRSGLTNGRAASWIRHGGGRRTGERLETRANRVLASRAASHRLPQALRKGLARRAVQRLVVGMDDHDNVIDARMLGERGDGARDASGRRRSGDIAWGDRARSLPWPRDLPPQ